LLDGGRERKIRQVAKKEKKQSPSAKNEKASPSRRGRFIVGSGEKKKKKKFGRKPQHERDPGSETIE